MSTAPAPKDVPLYWACLYTRDGCEYPWDFDKFTFREGQELCRQVQAGGHIHEAEDGSWHWFPPSMVRRIQFDPVEPATKPEDAADDQ